MPAGDPEKKLKPEEISLPAFWSGVSESDVESLAKQMKKRKFDASSVIAVAKRCKSGFPQVIVSSPLSRSGSPFPTLFWLTCPFLDRRCGELEAARLIAELEKLFERTPEAVRKMHKDYAALRLRAAGASLTAPMSKKAVDVLSRLGVGGIDASVAPNAVKCLHLQTATWLGMGEHPARRWLAEKLGALECGEVRCSARPGGRPNERRP